MFINIQRSMNRLNLTSKAFFARTPQFLNTLNPDILLSEETKPGKRTKTVCTIGYVSFQLGPRHSLLKARDNSLTKA